MLRQLVNPLQELAESEELTLNGQINLSKACLIALEKHFNIPNSTGVQGYGLFLRYFESFNLIGDETNFSAFKRTPELEKVVRKSLYQADSKKDGPGYFNVKKHQDLNRLSKMLGINTVIYLVNRFEDPIAVEVWHDFRALSFSEKPTIFFAITPEGFLKMVLQSLDALRTLPLFFASETLKESTLVGSLEALLQLQPSVSINSPLFYKNSKELIQNASALTAHYELSTSLVIVSYCKNTVLCGKWEKRKIRTKPSSNIFLRIAVLGLPIVSKEDVENSTIVCISGDFVCKLSSQFEAYLKTNMKNGYAAKSTLLDKPDDDKFFSKQIPKLRAHEIAHAKKRFYEKRQKARHRRQSKSQKLLQKQKESLLTDCQADESEPDAESADEVVVEEAEAIQKDKKIKLICECNICIESLQKFGSNMNCHGRERLMQVPLDIRDLLTILGLDSKTNLDIVEELCKMTIAAFDIESMTVDSDIEPPASCVASPAKDYSHLGGPGGAHIKKLQRPIMIAHTDCLSENDPNSMLLLTLASDDISSGYLMMQQYWEAILARKEVICRKKRKLAEPILAALEAYKEEHNLFMETRLYHRNNDSNLLVKAKQNFKHTLPGQLAIKLQRLISDYVVFSFYGSGYDHVLLESLLTCYLFEQKQKPVLEKNGNKVTVLRTSSGIVFRDICKLLAPNTSLRNFGKLFDLDQQKAHFPFKILTGVEALMLPNLPRDPDMWLSDITGKPISENDIETALRLFDQTGCTCVGDYLKHYLRLDVDILYRATNFWRKHLKDVINLDFIEARKYTVSSLSYLASGKSNAKLKRPGAFFPNNAQHYGLLKKGMRG